MGGQNPEIKLPRYIGIGSFKINEDIFVIWRDNIDKKLYVIFRKVMNYVNV